MIRSNQARARTRRSHRRRRPRSERLRHHRRRRRRATAAAAAAATARLRPDPRLLRRRRPAPLPASASTIINGAQLAHRRVQRANADCKVDASSSSTRRAAPTRPPSLATQAVGNDAIIGLVGPAFSGESARRRPDLRRGRPADDLPVGDQPDAHRATAGTPSTACSATTPPRARPPRRTSATPSGPRRSSSIDDASEYGDGLADIVEEDARRHRRRHRHHPGRADRLLGDRHQGQRLRRRRAVLRRLLRRGRPARQAAARRRLRGHVRRRPTA